MTAGPWRQISPSSAAGASSVVPNFTIFACMSGKGTPTPPSRYSSKGVTMMAVTASVRPYPSRSWQFPPCFFTISSKRSLTVFGRVSAPLKVALRQLKSVF